MTGLFLALIAILRAFPDVPFARWLHGHTVQQIASWQRSHFVFAAIFLVLLTAGQGLLALGSYDLMVVFAWDASLWMDGAFVVALLKARRLGAKFHRTPTRSTP